MFSSHQLRLARKASLTNIWLKGTMKSLATKRSFGKTSIPDPLNQIENINEASSLFEEMLRTRPRPAATEFTKILNFFVKQQQYGTVPLMIKRMLDSKTHIDMFHMTIEINCYCLLQRVDLGFSVFGRILKLGFEPNAYVYNIILKGLFCVDNDSEAELFFEKIVENKLCDPDAITICTMINGLCKSGYPMRAFETLRRAEKEKWESNVQCYSALIDGLCKALRVDHAVKVYRHMINRKVFPDIVTCTSLISGFCETARWTEANEFLMEIKRYRIWPNTNTYGVIIHHCSKIGTLQQAKAFFAIVTKDYKVQPSVFVYTSMIEACCKHGKINEAERFFEHAMALRLEDDPKFYSVLLHGYWTNGCTTRALRFFEEIPQDIITSDHDQYIWAITICGLFSNGKVKEGLKFFSELKNPNVFTCNEVLKGVADTFGIKRALAFLGKMEVCGIDADIVTCNILIDHLSRNRKPDMAKSVFEKLIPSKRLIPDRITYNTFARYCEDQEKDG